MELKTVLKLRMCIYGYTITHIITLYIIRFRFKCFISGEKYAPTTHVAAYGMSIKYNTCNKHLTLIKTVAPRCIQNI